MYRSSIKSDMYRFYSMLVFIKHDTKTGWVRYVNTRDIRKTHIQLYKALRREYLSGNRAGIIYLDFIHVYFDTNFEHQMPLIKVKLFERLWTKVKLRTNCEQSLRGNI